MKTYQDMRNNYQKIRKQKERKLKKRHFILVGLTAVFLDVLYSYTQNIKLVFLISMILIAVGLVSILGSKIEPGKESRSSYDDYIQ